METQPRSFPRCASCIGDIATACLVVRRLTDGELRQAEQGSDHDKVLSDQTETITKSVIAMGVLGCEHSEGALINQMTPEADGGPDKDPA